MATHRKAALSTPAPSMAPVEAPSIASRNTQELIFAFVGPVGSGVSTSVEILREELVKYGYEVTPTIRLSEFIENEAPRVGMAKATHGIHSGRVDYLQTVGNKLREKFGPNYLAKKAVKVIAERRVSDGFETEVEGAPQRPKVIRRAHIIDSLKNDAELSLLKEVYRNILIVFGVFAPDHIRRKRLKAKKISEDEINKMIRRDNGEGIAFGQQVARMFSNSDFFVRNDQSTQDGLKSTLRRYVEVIFQLGIHTATSAEAAMHEASAVAAKSACMSRQVGAAIVDENGQLISVGWNDVPKFGGGLYAEDDQNWVPKNSNKSLDNDNGCFRWGDKICHNDQEKRAIEENLFQSMRSSGIVDDNVPDDAIRFAIKGSGIENLIEFSRAIHAEMEAILSVARDARHSLKGASLYTTTYPCHNWRLM